MPNRRPLGLLLTTIGISSCLAAQGNIAFDRPVSFKSLAPNILADQKNIWIFPTKLNKKKNLLPAAAVVGTTVALIALDSHDAPYFRRTSSFAGFNKAFSGKGTSIVTFMAPVGLYAAGFARGDSEMSSTALLAGEALVSSEILASVLKIATRRVRPAKLSPVQSFSGTFFENKGPALRTAGSFPSGHTIAAFSVATIISRRYGNHKWVPYASYGMAALIGFSRVSLSTHFVSDVFAGGALGYSISRFAVLRQ